MVFRIPFLVINLDGSHDRWENMQEMASEVGIVVERIPAVDGNTILKSDWQDFSLLKFHLFHGRRPKGAEYGCYMSHIRALEVVIKRKLPYAVILEDDACLLPDALVRIESIVREFKDFDVIKLYNHRVNGFVVKKKTTAGDEIGRCVHGPFGSAMGYLVTEDGAALLLKSLKPMFLPYDIALERGWYGKFKIYLTRTALIQPSKNSIHSTIGGYKTTKFPWIMRIPTALFRGQDYIARMLYAYRG